jgi:predicted transcriptional regulator
MLIDVKDETKKRLDKIRASLMIQSKDASYDKAVAEALTAWEEKYNDKVPM